MTDILDALDGHRGLAIDIDETVADASRFLDDLRGTVPHWNVFDLLQDWLELGAEGDARAPTLHPVPGALEGVAGAG